MQDEGASVGHLHLKYLSPLQSNVEELLRSFRRVLIAELNGGQLGLLLRGRFLVPAAALTQVRGQPLKVGDVMQAAKKLLAEGPPE